MRHQMLIFSDTHLGRKLQLGMPRRYQDRLLTAQKRQLELIYQVARQSDVELVCLGDVFDSPVVSYDALNEGFRLDDNCDILLRGNHDEFKHNTTNLTAVDLLKNGLIADSPYGDNTFDTDYIPTKGERVVWYRIHHKPTQDQFEYALRQAVKFAEAEENITAHILFLHCNVGDQFANETDNYVTDATLDWLLKTFSYIAIGHEHNSKLLFDGRVLVCGSILPLSFGEVTDKFFWFFNIESGFHKHRIFNVEKQFKRIDLNESTLAADQDIPQVLEVVGDVARADLPAIQGDILTLLDKNPKLYMVKLNLQTLSEELQEQQEPVILQSVTDLVKAELTEEEQELMSEAFDLYKGAMLP